MCFVALTTVSIPARAEDSAQNDPRASILPECHLLRRAISRRACQARLLCEEKTIDITAENESKVMNHNF